MSACSTHAETEVLWTCFYQIRSDSTFKAEVWNPRFWHHWSWDWFSANHDQLWMEQNPICLQNVQ